MALPVNILELIKGKLVEWDRLEFKEERNLFLVTLPCHPPLKLTKSVTKSVELVDFLDEEKTRESIMSFLEIGNQTINFDNNIRPLLNSGIIEYTIPDKPKSRHQSYRLTEKGRKLLKQ
jgi:ATP-dependent DNA helicase RecG